MNNFKVFFFILIPTIILSFSGFSQTKNITLKELADKKAKQSYDFPSEKTYLSFDKPYYAVGDTIWFKAYVTLENHLPSPISKILYVDLINQKDSVVESLKIPIKNSVGKGSFLLPYPNFKEGNYHLRAYTKWMLNFGEAYFFKKNIVIGNALSKTLITQINFDGSINDKSQNVKTKIIFKDEYGKVLADKKVNWEVTADYERVARGRETTNAKGEVFFNFNTDNKVALNTGTLTTSLDAGDNRTLMATFPLKTAILEYDLQFFPEGGDLIDGITTKVAFKAQRSDGLGANFTGKIVDDQGIEIATISPSHVGIGNFEMTPKKDRKYFANVKFPNGKQKTLPLPNVKSNGITLSTEIKKDSLNIHIKANDAYLENNKNQLFYIAAQNSKTLFYAAQSIVRVKDFNINIPVDKLPTGILQISLLNQAFEPLSERLTFIQRKDDMKITLRPDLPAYKSRSKIKMSIQTSGGLDMTAGNYAVSVINEAKVPYDDDKATTILSYFLLNSDLAGYIEKPNYYFKNVGPKKITDLDNLMLTQGYVKFVYKDVAADKSPNIVAFPENSLTISGTIRKNDGLPLQNGRILFQIPDKYFNTTGTTDKEGHFKFENLIFKDSSEVVINARNNLDSKNLRINVDGEAFPSIYKNINSADDVLNIDSALETYLKSSKIEHQSAFLLREVVVKAAATKKIDHSNYPALTGLSPIADRQLDGAQFQGCNLLVNCLSAAGLTYQDQQLYLSKTYNQGLKVPIEIYVNGLQVDVNYLASLDPKAIDNIEVFNNDGLTGINKLNGTSGVVSINMKELKKTPVTKEQLKDLFGPTNVLTYKPRGYSADREFYTPKFAGPRTSLQAQDNRTTIYWNPYVITDKDGKGSFEFYNSDDKGPYKITIEGIDANGNIGRAVYTYELRQ
ncbi:carboxypeptidase regulatory-like domain-containing protein [Pedobacter sp. SD-b]|uniref:Carboxypeptidase regulatory-like domain-containing protein n=1 Tax=Pedobacter segetis TaxID=2793069 RepID=A0ABS1BHY2_9SPHI|nr:carboxypeptidase-like regulatory domain-containing protein [Pedobacter segetis]MBK0382492.1 carboxypeptidase regulatory-like domain-containing protein [Pedobacter segetis]